MLKIEKPDDFYCRLSDSDKFNFFIKNVYKNICPTCNGKKFVHREEDRDCYEGYKLAPRYKCNDCDGSGIDPIKVEDRFVTYNLLEMSKYYFDLDLYTRVSQAISKLTPAELRLVRAYHIESV